MFNTTIVYNLPAGVQERARTLAHCSGYTMKVNAWARPSFQEQARTPRLFHPAAPAYFT